MSEAAEKEEGLAEGTLLSHLVELRNRLVKIAAAVIVLFAVLIPFNQRIYELVSEPLFAASPGVQMIITGTAAPLLVPFKLTFIVALILAMPIVLYQVWAFVAPGLYRKEKHFAFPLLATSILLFYAGIAFAYYVVFPLVFGFFGSIEIDGAPWTPDIASYLDFITSIVLAFGIAFEVPIATLLLVWAGLTTTFDDLSATFSAGTSDLLVVTSTEDDTVLIDNGTATTFLLDLGAGNDTYRFGEQAQGEMQILNGPKGLILKKLPKKPYNTIYPRKDIPTIYKQLLDLRSVPKIENKAVYSETCNNPPFANAHPRGAKSPANIATDPIVGSAFPNASTSSPPYVNGLEG